MSVEPTCKELRTIHTLSRTRSELATITLFRFTHHTLAMFVRSFKELAQTWHRRRLWDEDIARPRDVDWDNSVVTVPATGKESPNLTLITITLT